MARGWESKSVESQQEEPLEQRGSIDPLQKKRESLELSRRRILNDLKNARSDVHRAALENALKHLDDELRNLSGAES